MARFALAVFLAGAVAGCTCGFNSTRLEAHRCGPAGDCPAGEVCENGFCLPSAADGGDLLDTPEAADPPADPPADGCAAGQIVCNATCVDPSTDPLNCGGCGGICTGGTCVSGVCVGGCPAPCDPVFGVCTGGTCGCTSGLIACGAASTCRDTMNDPDNCGGCGVLCRSTEYCTGGACVCRPGLTLCSGNCVDLASNDRNCGLCGRTCTGATDFCYASACTASACPPEADNCNPGGESCVLLTAMDTHPLNCGGCGNVCARSGVCTAGACEPFTIGRTCSSCPCADCPAGSTCCAYPGAPSGPVVCLTAGAPCP